MRKRRYKHLSRTEVRKVACPECGAGPNERCWRLKKGGGRYRGETNHLERVRVASENPQQRSQRIKSEIREILRKGK